MKIITRHMIMKCVQAYYYDASRDSHTDSFEGALMAFRETFNEEPTTEGKVIIHNYLERERLKNGRAP